MRSSLLRSKLPPVHVKTNAILSALRNVFACLLLLVFVSQLHAQVTSAQSSVTFGSVAVEATTGNTQSVSFTIPSGLTLGGISAVTEGVPDLDFTVVTGGTCGLGSTDTTCTVNVQFLPTAVGTRLGAVGLTDQSGNTLISVPINGIGIGPLVAFGPGIISTVAGTGTYGYNGDNIPATSAELFQPYAVAVNAAGNVYIADSDNNRVRLVTPGGIITTVAGTGAFGYNGDNIAASSAELNYPTSVAVDGAGNLYIADTGNNRVRKVTPGGTITTVAGIGGTSCSFTGDGGQATSAALCYPYGVAVDGSGNFYFADNGNNRVRKVTPGGTITTVAGNGTQGYNGDNIAATGAELYSPSAIAVDGSGNLYIVDSDYRIRKVTMPGGTITTVAGNGLVGFNGDNIAATSAELNNVNGVAVDGSGNLYIADSYNQRVRKVTPGGTIATVAGNGTSGYNNDNIPASSAELHYPAGIVVDGSGNLYIADLGNNRIRKVDVSDPPAPTFAGTSVGSASASQDVTVLNLGDAPLDITQISTAANFSLGGADTTCSSTGQTLSAAASCVLGIEFNPTANGSISGSVVLTDNSLNASAATQTIPLQGTGTGPQSQTITFPNPAPQTYGVAPITLTATATSGLPVSYTVTSGPGSVSGSTLTITGAGSVTVQAIQPGDGINWTAATSVSQSFTVNPAALTVTANNANMVYGQAVPSFSYTVTGFVNSDTSAVLSGTATETTAATSTSPAGTYPITFTTEPITAANYTFSYGSGTLTISGGAAQTITFGALPNVTYGVSPITLGATASSNLPVSYAATGPATVSNSTLTITGAGSVTVTANQAGNANYGAATSVSQSFTVNPTTPTVSFTGAPASAGYTSTFTVSATTNASSAAVFSATGACTVAASGVVTITSGTGTCSLSANWAADSNYLAASATQSTTAKSASQTITVGTPAPGSAAYGGNFTVAATANSGLTVAYTSSGGCTNSGATYTMTSPTTACSVIFNQAGNTNYAAATQVTETVTAAKATQTITVTTAAPSSAAYKSIFPVVATASSGLTVAIAVSGGCTISSGTVTMSSPTTACTVKINQAGNVDYNAATQVTETIAAAKATQTITVVTAAPSSAAYGSKFTVAATANSGLTVAYTSSGGCTNSGATFTMTSGTTSCAVQFNQAGNTDYNASTQVAETVTATKATQTITFPIPGTKTYGVAPITLTAKASSGLAVSYSVTSGPAAVSGSVLTITGAGSVTVQASQAGNANFAGATAVSVTFTVNKATSTTTIMSETPNPSISGQAVVVGFTVSGVGIAPTGTVTLSGSGGLTCTGTLSAGAGSCSLTFTTTGSKTLTAAYSGDSNYNTSTSAAVTQKVKP